MSLVLTLLLQLVPQLPDPDANVIVGGEIEGPYIYLEVLGQTSKVILKNGLTVLVRESNAVPLTSITTHVKVGSFDEPDHLSGISHLIEHMFFKGTEDRGVGEIARQTAALGGSLNAYTYYDRTVYQTVVPSENAIAAMEIQADALWNPAFDLVELATEIEVVIQENNLKLDSPTGIVEERLYETAFSDHRIGRWQSATPEGLRGLTWEEVVGFHTQYYQPSNVIVAVVGQFHREEILEEIVRIYSDESDTPVERNLLPQEPPQAGLQYDWERGPITEAQVAIGYHVPGLDGVASDVYALKVLSAILTGGRASRMNWFLRDEQGSITSAVSSYLALKGLGYFILRLEGSDPSTAQIDAFGELDRIRRFGVDGESLARAKILIAQDYYQRLETVRDIADELALAEANGDWKRLDFFLDGIQAVRRDDIQVVVNKYFDRDNLTVFEYLPESMPRTQSTAEYEANVLDQVPLNIVERSIDELEVSAQLELIDNELVVDVIQPFVRRSIRGGFNINIDAYMLEDHRLPLVSFGIFFPGGRLYESVENAGITELMLRTALRGTRRYNTADISRRIENAGARIKVVNEPDFFGYVLNGVSGQLDQALGVLMEVLQEPTFLEPVVEQEKAFQQARISRFREYNAQHSIQLFMSTLFDDHSYGRSNVGTEESLAALDSDTLFEWQRRHQRTVVPLIVIAGDIRGTGLLASIAETLTNEDLIPRNTSVLPVPEVPFVKEEFVHMADWRQSMLVYGTLAVPSPHQDRWPLTVIRNVLSGLGGRLVEAIRDEQGLAYMLNVEDAFLARSGTFFAYTAFSPENEALVRRSLEQEIERLIEDGVTQEELNNAVNYSIGSHEISQQTRSVRVMELARALMTGAETSAVEDYSAQIRRVDSDLIHATVQKYLNPSQARTVILRGSR